MAAMKLHITIKLNSLSFPVIALTLFFFLSSTLHAQDKAESTSVKKSSIYVKSSAKNPLADFRHDDPIKRMEKQMRIQVEWIELSHTDFTKLMEEYNSTDSNALNSSNDGPLRAKLKKMIEEDDAEIIDTIIVMARSGQRAKVESIIEVIYPTAYERSTSEKAADNKKGRLAKASDNEDRSSKTGERSDILPVATSYETRNVGTTLEVDPVLGADDRTVDLSLSPEIIYHVGHEEYGFYKEGESEVGAKVPLFYTMKLTAQVSMIVGEYLFAGVQSPFDMESMKADRDRKVMIFLKADLLYVGLPLKEEKKAEQKGEVKKQISSR